MGGDRIKMQTIIIVKDKLGYASFAVYAETLQEAQAKLASLELNMDEFEITEFQDDKIFDYYIDDLIQKQQEEISPAKFLRDMIQASRDDNPRAAHEKLDKVLCETLEKINPLFRTGIMIFDSSERWYS